MTLPCSPSVGEAAILTLYELRKALYDARDDPKRLIEIAEEEGLKL